MTEPIQSAIPPGPAGSTGAEPDENGTLQYHDISGKKLGAAPAGAESSAPAASDPYAAYGGSIAPAAKSDNGTSSDPYAAYGGNVAPEQGAEKPGFVSRALEGLGLPKNKEELQAIGEASKLTPMNALRASVPIIDAAEGLWGYAKRVAGNVYNDSHEEYEAARNIAQGGPIGANLGKAGYAVAHGIVANIPFVGEPAENLGTDVENKNYGAAGGDVAAIVGQTVVPEAVHEYIRANPSAAKTRLNRLKSAVNDHAAAETVHQVVTDGHQIAMDQVVEAQHRADVAAKNEIAGQGTKEQTDTARTNLTEATANLQRTGDSVKIAAEKKAQAAARVEMAQRDLENAAKPKPKVKLGTPEEIKKSNEDFAAAIPSGPGKSAYTPEDLTKVRPLLENTHVGTTPVDSPEAVYDSMQGHLDRMETELKPWLDKYKDEHPSLGVNDQGEPISIKQRMVDALADDEKGRPGFTEKAMKVLEDYENTTDPTISEAERLRKSLNDDNRGMLQKNRMDIATARATDPEFAGRYELAKIIREGTYGLLEDKGVKNAAQLRNLDASVIRVRNAADRMIPKSDVKMRGSGEAGPIRRGAAYLAKKTGAVIGAGVGFEAGGGFGAEAGAFLGNAAGDKLAGALNPGDLTRSQRIARSMGVRHTTGEFPTLETHGAQPSNPPAFGLPPEVTPPSAPVHPNNMTDLHADIAAYSGELPTPGSYERQEDKFLSDYAIKRKYGILEPTDKKLFQQIGKAEIENAQASKTAQAEKVETEQKEDEEAKAKKEQENQAIIADENVAHSPILKATEPAMEINSVEGRPSPEVHEHEHGHIMANVAEGLEPFNFLSENHADAKAQNAAAAIQTDVSAAKPGMQGLEQRVVGILGGPAFDEVHNELPLNRNTGARSDIARARFILREEGGLKGEELNKVFDELYDRAKGHVSNPEALALVQANAPLREKNLHQDYHMSTGRLSEYVKKLKGAYNGKTPTTTGVHEGGADGGISEGEPTDTGREGKEQNGLSEKVPAEEARKTDEVGGTETSKVSKTPELRVPFKEGRTPPGERSISPEVDEKIKAGGGIPGGLQKGDPEIGVPDLAFIHDPTTGSSLALPPDKITPESVKEVLRKSRETYLKANPEQSRIPQPGQPGYDEEIHGANPLEQSNVSRTPEQQHKQRFQIKVTENGEEKTIPVEAFSRKIAFEEAQKRFPNASQFDLAREEGEELPRQKGYVVPTEKHLSTPSSGENSRLVHVPVEKTMIHELGHTLMGHKDGLNSLGIARHTHPDMPNGMNAAARWDLTPWADKTGMKIAADKVPSLLRMLMGGVAADEAFSDLPRTRNNNFDTKLSGSDGNKAISFLRKAGYQDSLLMEKMVHDATDEAVKHLTKPAVSDIIKENAGVREPGLSKQYHYSGARLREMGDEVTRRLNGQTTDNGTTNGLGDEERGADVGGREGEGAGASGPRVRSIEQSNIDHDEVLDNIKRAYGVHDDPKLAHVAGFITPDGRYIDIPGAHTDAIEEHGGAPAHGTGVDNRRDFINDTKAIRVHRMGSRGGQVLAFSVPKDGVNTSQVDAMTRSFGANGDRNGLLRMERADISPENAKKVFAEKEFPSPSDVKPMLRKIQALEQSNADAGQLATHEKEGGSTFTPEGENLAGKDLYSVGAHPDRTLQVDKLTPEVLADFKAKNADVLADGQHAVGTWKDPDTGKAVLDITKLHANRDEAIAAGKAANQKGIYHLGGEGYIGTGGTGEGALEQSNASKAEDFNFGKNEGTEDQQKGIISTAVPTGTKAIADPHSENVHVGMHSVTPEAATKIANKIREMPGMRMPEGVKDPQKVINRYIDQFKNNLKDLYNQVPKETRDATAKWYESANNIADRISSKYGKSTKQGAGVLAAMSPQKDWNMNVGLAERLTDIYHQHGDDTLSPEARTKAKEVGLGGMAAAIGDKTLNQLTEPLEKAAFIRIWDETHNDRSFKNVDPGTGEYTHTMTNNDGSNSKIAWGALNEIAKAVNILDDGTRENISRNLGGSHKVRNFYNNIVDPNNPGGHVTIDTHAVAAGHQRPLSGKDPEVLDNFGRLSVAATGLKGTYAVHAEAYRQAARELGIQPRQLQSIVWEQVRKNFPAELKSSPEHRAAIDAIWAKYKDGKITQPQAQQQVSAYAKTAREKIEANAEKPSTQPDLAFPILPSKFVNFKSPVGEGPTKAGLANLGSLGQNK